MRGSSWRILPAEVVAWGSFGREVVDDNLYFGIFESAGREFELVRGF
jgi:hypothetical protein